MWFDAKFLQILKSVYHNVWVEDLDLLGCDAVLLGEWLDCWTLEDESTMIRLNTGNHASCDATLCPRRPESWNQNDFKVFPFFCLTKLLLTCVILGLCTYCNKYVTLYMVWNSLHVYMWYVANNGFWVITQWLTLYLDWTQAYMMEFSCGFSTDPDSYRIVI